jgi:MFS superfamily sulfate permease-like transporter
MNKQIITKDIFSSLVVFLVALPISLGVAVAAGVEPYLGLTCAIIGGLVASTLTGSPLQISGPSTGLAVMVLHVVQKFGVAALIPLGIITGLFQMAIALFKVGHLFQATPPALVKAMLSGIGFLIVISQVFIFFGSPMSSDSYMNIINLPSMVNTGISGGGNSLLYGGIVVALVLGIMIFWSKQKSIIFHLIPGSLVAVIVSAAITAGMGWDIPKISFSSSFADIFANIHYTQALDSISISLILYSIGFAFVASVETMLCVSALDKMTHTHSKYNKTILAQGIGNLFAGAIGTIPIVGVISRSAANVEAGAKTKLAGVLNAVWIMMIFFVPFVLQLIPIAALVGLLLFIGFKLLDLSHIFDYVKKYNKTSWIFATTFILTISVDLLIGVVAGFIVAIFILLFEVLKYDLIVEEEYGNKVLTFTGKLSFLDLPVLNKELNDAGNSAPSNLEVCLREVQYLDPTIKDHLDQWAIKMEKKGINVEIKNSPSSDEDGGDSPI